MKKTLLTATFIAGCGFCILIAEPPPSPAVFTVAQSAAGKAEYQKDCFRCHTDKLTGRVGDPNELPAVGSLDAGAQKMIQGYGGKVPALAGPRFMARWGANITAYILEYNGARPGTEALTKDTDVEVQSILGQTAK